MPHCPALFHLGLDPINVFVLGFFFNSFWTDLLIPCHESHLIPVQKKFDFLINPWFIVWEAADHFGWYNAVHAESCVVHYAIRETLKSVIPVVLLEQFLGCDMETLLEEIFLEESFQTSENPSEIISIHPILRSGRLGVLPLPSAVVCDNFWICKFVINCGASVVCFVLCNIN